MRYGIFSDVHSNIEALEAVIGAYKLEGIDRYLCAGDIVGYGPDPSESIRKVRGLTEDIVAGNHDWASANLYSIEYFNQAAAAGILWTRKNISQEEKDYLQSLKLIFKNEDLTMVHGTLDHPRDFNYMINGYIAWETFCLLKTPVCFIGHTHQAGIFIKSNDDSIIYRQEDYIKIEKKNKYIINVGSVGQPRDGNPKAAYCVYDSKTGEVWIKRVSYNVEKTREKINSVKLPSFLADRLSLGR